MKDFFDSTLFTNPLYEYLKWICTKVYYQLKYWGDHLRIDYKAFVRRTVFGRYNYIGKNVILGDCHLGDFSYISDNCTITNTYIGKFCSIGPNVRMAPGKHPTAQFVSTHPSTFSNPPFMKKNFATQPMFTGNMKVTIGNDVWIGANCIILDGVNIKDGAVIAANSVVTKDVESYCIVGGSPAKFIRKRFEDNEIGRLALVRWWDRGEEWIQDHIHSFWNIDDFMRERYV